MSTVDDLTTPLTLDEARGSIYNVLAVTGVTTTVWKPGAVVRTIISAVAIVMVALSMLINALANSSFLALASGEWLRLVALYVYNVVRIEATFATGLITLINASGANYTIAAGDLTLKNPTTKQLYVNVSPITLNAGVTLIGVPIASSEQGSAATSFGGEISLLVTSLSGVTCTNPSPVVGFDVESDPALRIRCTKKLGSLSPNGPSDAYEFFALSAVRADGSPVGITRARAIPDGIGGVDVYIANASGVVSGTAGDLATDLGVVDDLIQRNAVPLSVTCRTHSVTTISATFAYSLWLYNTAGVTSQDVIDAVSAALVTYLNSAPIGGDVIDGNPGAIYLSELSAVIGRVQSAAGVTLPVVRLVLTSPGADIALSAGQIATLGPVTASVFQISRKAL